KMRLAIANRGEVAVRIIRACQELGIESVLLHATLDQKTLAWRLADETVELPGDRLEETYLNADRLLEAAQIAKADAVHPGFGFLSEDADFAQATADAGLKFIGPDVQAMRLTS